MTLLIDTEHHRLLGGVQVEADDIGDLLLQLRIGAVLEATGPMGLEIVIPQTRSTVDLLTPTRSATSRLDQWVSPLGGRPRVELMIFATTCSSWVRGRPRPGASSSKPATPAS